MASFAVNYRTRNRQTPPAPQIHCRMLNGKTAIDGALAPDHRSEARLRIDPKVLVFVETTYTQLGKSITELLVHNRIKGASSIQSIGHGAAIVKESSVCKDNATSVAITGINKFKIMNLFQLSARQTIHHRLLGDGGTKDFLMF
uniref:Heparan sulfate-N-deacetylase N-terminal domain-containing protein n=1 Tax=Anopheles culicifacies TaxID=139723 RepID=A0A182MAG4_9DIPT